MSMFDDEILTAVAETLDAARAADAMIVTAESCTGGLVAAALTAVPGSSDAVEGGFVTYSNAAKERLGVDPATLAAHGAVSEAVARALAEAALARSGGPSLVAASVTGVAGPGGGSAEKPVGLVHFGAADGRGTIHRAMHFGDVARDSIRRSSVLIALELVRERLRTSA
jgi:nicotinamide-nucleotide amidase